jgi:hypothetical protein
MQLTELVLVATTTVAIVGGVAAVIRERYKPRIDLANSDQVRAQVRKFSEEFNARRDLRQLQVENWAFNQVRPWGRDVVQKFDKQSDLLHGLAARIGVEVPAIHLDAFPEIPPPILGE